MTSRKRWQQIYAAENPFRLPQSLVKNLRKCSRAAADQEPDAVRYLWIHLSDEVFVPRQLRDHDDGRELAKEDWLNVIDESASLGAESLIISMGCSPSERPEVWDLCRWAQTTHAMTVGLYVCDSKFNDEDLRQLGRLDKDKTRVFVESEHLDSMRRIEELGVQLLIADGLLPDEPAPRTCHLPETMTCVGSKGTLYTCGLVLGDDRFRLGEVQCRRLDGVMADGTLPHTVPEGAVAVTGRRCNACPPLMERKMRGLSGH